MNRVQIARWAGYKLGIASLESTSITDRGTVALCFIEGNDILFLTKRGEEFRFANKCFREKDDTFRFPNENGENAILTPPPTRKKFRRR